MVRGIPVENRDSRSPVWWSGLSSVDNGSNPTCLPMASAAFLGLSSWRDPVVSGGMVIGSGVICMSKVAVGDWVSGGVMCDPLWSLPKNVYKPYAPCS
ncbi:MAG: hypothetical protein NVSMB4_09740 [Acidimicrobiales bacterium]